MLSKSLKVLRWRLSNVGDGRAARAYILPDKILFCRGRSRQRPDFMGGPSTKIDAHAAQCKLTVKKTTIASQDKSIRQKAELLKRNAAFTEGYARKLRLQRTLDTGSASRNVR